MNFGCFEARKRLSLLFIYQSHEQDRYCSSPLLCSSTLHYDSASNTMILLFSLQGLNVYSILQHDTLVMTLGAIRKIEDRLHKPINR